MLNARSIILAAAALGVAGAAIADPAERFERVRTTELTVGAGADAPSVQPGAFLMTARGVCPIEPTLQNYVGTGSVIVPGFTAGEEAAAILNAPADHYPIEIVAIGVGWSSTQGGAPNSLEDSLRIYPAGLPNPGVPQFEVLGPVLVDGAINEFDITSFPGDRIIDSGPFTVSLRLGNSSTLTGPAPLHDGAGCLPGRSAVFVNGETWIDNCALGVTGQWVLYAKYRRVNCDSITDCNGNGIDDAMEIDQGLAQDCNGNGIPDECDIAAGAPDLNGDGIPDECQVPCEADLSGDGNVGTLDLAILLAAWGACP